jgi:hypothetical protein
LNSNVRCYDNHTSSAFVSQVRDHGQVLYSNALFQTLKLARAVIALVITQMNPPAFSSAQD